MYARLYLPTPPITEEAAVRTQEREIQEDIERQGGFARVSLLAALAAVGAALLVAGCQTPPHRVLQVACDTQPYRTRGDRGPDRGPG